MSLALYTGCVVQMPPQPPRPQRHEHGRQGRSPDHCFPRGLPAAELEEQRCAAGHQQPGPPEGKDEQQVRAARSVRVQRPAATGRRATAGPAGAAPSHSASRPVPRRRTARTRRTGARTPRAAGARWESGQRPPPASLTHRPAPPPPAAPAARRSPPAGTASPVQAVDGHLALAAGVH
eukprot:7228148-Lingulodinium_polyedra.AAC.1